MSPTSHVATYVLLANEPLAYRQALVQALETRRPDLHVVSVIPDALDAAIQEHAPFLVICDRLTAMVESCVNAWIVLYPGGARRVTSSFGGASQTTADMDFSELLVFLDRAEAFANC